MTFTQSSREHRSQTERVRGILQSPKDSKREQNQKPFLSTMGLDEEQQSLRHQKVLLDDFVIGEKGFSLRVVRIVSLESLSIRHGILFRGLKTPTRGKKCSRHSRIKINYPAGQFLLLSVLYVLAISYCYLVGAYYSFIMEMC